MYYMDSNYLNKSNRNRNRGKEWKKIHYPHDFQKITIFGLTFVSFLARILLTVSKNNWK